MSECRKCASLCVSREGIVYPDVPEFGRTCKLLLIGEAPGVHEDHQGRGFVGTSGKTLHRLLEEQGLHRGYDYGCANLVRCRPPDNRKPTKKEIVNCLPHLVSTIALARPEAVLTVGATATAALTGIARLETSMALLEAHNYDPVSAALLYRVDLRAAWPRRCRLYAMPHTSPLAWNRSSPGGEKWSDHGKRIMQRLGKDFRACGHDV